MKKPLTAVEAQIAYKVKSLDQLLEMCHERIPGFAVDLHVFPRPMGGVMVTWRYNMAISPMWAWQRTRPEEVRMGGTYQSVREALVAVLGRADRFDQWSYEQDQQKKQDAVKRAARAAEAAPVEKTPVVDAAEEMVEVPELPPVKPLPPDPLAEVGGKPAAPPPSDGPFGRRTS